MTVAHPFSDCSKQRPHSIASTINLYIEAPAVSIAGLKHFIYEVANPSIGRYFECKLLYRGSSSDVTTLMAILMMWLAA
jgi:hypothetical protein